MKFNKRKHRRAFPDIYASQPAPNGVLRQIIPAIDPAGALIQIQRMRLEFFELYHVECAFVRRGKHDARRDASQECIFPTRDADAPFVAGL